MKSTILMSAHPVADTDHLEAKLAPGDEFEFDDSTLKPGISRVVASVGFRRIPGTIDSRPAQQR